MKFHRRISLVKRSADKWKAFRRKKRETEVQDTTLGGDALAKRYLERKEVSRSFFLEKGMAIK